MAELETLMRDDDWAVARSIGGNSGQDGCFLISQKPEGRTLLIQMFLTRDNVPGLEIFIHSGLSLPGDGQTTAVISVGGEDWRFPVTHGDSSFVARVRMDRVARDLIDALRTGDTLTASLPDLDVPPLTWSLAAVDPFVDAAESCFFVIVGNAD